ncbi:hypothetical protein BE20_12265 [Sorangium cellulosum]|nr:hypothetical protein BE20_12265 [Sorangium cellulosum]
MSAVEPEMTARPPAAPHRRLGAHVYRRPPEPVVFPEAEEVPETNELRTALYLILKRELAHAATLGSDQFVYWDPTTPRKRLAPDAFVRLGAPHRTRTWKTWLHGAPDLGVEIVSESDEGEPAWEEKLERYRAGGRALRSRRRRAADPRLGCARRRSRGAVAGRPGSLRVRDAGLWWTVVEDPSVGPMLRLARDREGRELLPTPDAAAKEREAAAKAREAEAEAREANRKLQAELDALRAELAQATGKQTPR